MIVTVPHSHVPLPSILYKGMYVHISVCSMAFSKMGTIQHWSEIRQVIINACSIQPLQYHLIAPYRTLPVFNVLLHLNFGKMIHDFRLLRFFQECSTYDTLLPMCKGSYFEDCSHFFISVRRVHWEKDYLQFFALDQPCKKLYFDYMWVQFLVLCLSFPSKRARLLWYLEACL